MNPADTLPNLDSIFQAYCAMEPQLHTSLFTGHNLQEPLQSAPRSLSPAGSLDWLFLTLLLLSGLLSLIVNRTRLRMSHLFKSLVDGRSLARVVRDSSAKGLRSLLPMALIYVVCVALLLPAVVQGQSPLHYLLAIVLAVACYFVRNGLCYLMGVIFDNSEAGYLYLHNTYLYNAAGALLLPLLLLFAYFSPAPQAFLIASAILVGTLLLARLIRGLILIFSTAKNSHFYLFYYLCTLEVVPLLVLLKLFIL